MVAAALAGDRRKGVRLEHCNPRHFGSLIVKLEDAGASVTLGTTGSRSRRRSASSRSTPPRHLSGFPTDMQASGSL